MQRTNEQPSLVVFVDSRFHLFPFTSRRLTLKRSSAFLFLIWKHSVNIFSYAVPWRTKIIDKRSTADSGARRTGFRGERENDSGVKANRIPG